MIGITGLGQGIDNYVMNSHSNVEKIVQAFEVAIEEGYHPNDVEGEIYRQVNVDPSTLTSYEKQQIQNKVSKIYQSKFYMG
jgi:hypothetical protein